MAKIFIILLLITIQASANNPCDITREYIPIKDRYESGLLFELKKCGQPSSYLFGTMHSDSADLISIIEPAKKAMLRVESANFEIKSGQGQTAAAFQSMYYPPNGTKTLISTIGLDLYRKLQELLAEKRPDMPEITFQRMKPWAIAVLMQYPQSEGDGVHLDLRLEKFAEANNRQVFGLETAAEQLKFFDDLSEQDSIEFLVETMENYDQAQQMTDQLTDAYIEQDLFAIAELADKAFLEMSNADFQKKFMDELIKKRNKIMLQRSLPRVEVGTFIAVGALHLPWEDGLLKLFEDEGYHIYVTK